MNNYLLSLLAVLFCLMKTSQSACEPCYTFLEKEEIECMISDLYSAMNGILSGDPDAMTPVMFNDVLLSRIFSDNAIVCINREGQETESTEAPETTEAGEEPEDPEEPEALCPDGDFTGIGALTGTLASGAPGLRTRLLEGIGNAFGLGHMAFSCVEGTDPMNIEVRIANTFFVDGEPVFVNDVFVFENTGAAECGRNYRVLSWSSLGLDEGLIDTAQDAAEATLDAAEATLDALEEAAQ